ncbi:MAG: hypothetical protein AB1656_08265 [Candidatus Omnitrophota bacterium]
MRKKIFANSSAARILLAGLLCLLLALLMGWRYSQLKARVRTAQFFINASRIIHFSLFSMGPEPSADLPGEWKKEQGSLTPFIRKTHPDLGEKFFRDPFPANGAAPFLDVRYGVAHHPAAAMLYPYNLSRPSCFTWSAGPSRQSPSMDIRDATPQERIYDFQSSPFHPSNGLYSKGYLFYDSQGAAIGKIDR